MGALSGSKASPEAQFHGLRPSGYDPERNAAEAEKLGKRYREIQNSEYCCSEIVCTFPHDGNCWCFNQALAEHVAIAMETRRAETTGSAAKP